MLLGKWRNFEELEDELSLDELKLILNAQRERELRKQKFQAAIQGIDLDKEEAKSAADRFMEVKQKVDARLAGMDEEIFELNQLGFDVETDEDEEW